MLQLPVLLSLSTLSFSLVLNSYYLACLEMSSRQLLSAKKQERPPSCSSNFSSLGQVQSLNSSRQLMRWPNTKSITSPAATTMDSLDSDNLKRPTEMSEWMLCSSFSLSSLSFQQKVQRTQMEANLQSACVKWFRFSKGSSNMRRIWLNDATHSIDYYLFQTDIFSSRASFTFTFASFFFHCFYFNFNFNSKSKFFPSSFYFNTNINSLKGRPKAISFQKTSQCDQSQ